MTIKKFPIIFCILALLTAACMAPGSSGNAGPGAAGSQEQKTMVPGMQVNTSRLPPNAAIAACSGKSAGMVCLFEDQESVIGGTCDDKPGVLACAPYRSQAAGQVSGEQNAPAGTGIPKDTRQPGITQTGQTGAGAGTVSFILASPAGKGNGIISAEYTCDGAGSTPALTWSGAPAGTKEYALMMTTLPVDGSTRWNWVLYGIPGDAIGLAKNSTGVGTTGTGSHGTVMQYDPPCSQGPGAKVYTFTLYALSASPVLPDSAEKVTGPVLTSAIAPITLGKTSLSLSYTRR